MQKIRVIHLLRSEGYSGAENVVISIIKGMREYCDSIYVSPKGQITKILQKNSIRHYAIPDVSAVSIRKAVHYLNPDIIHAHDYTMGVIAGIAGGSTPIISHLHNNPPWIKKAGIKSVVYACSSLRFKKIFAVSDAVWNEYVFKILIRGKTRVIGNPINVSEIVKKAKQKHHTESYKIAFVGRFCEQKNPLRYLRLVNEIRRNIPDISAVMIGDGEMRNVVENEAKQLGLESVLTFTGFIDNPYSILENAKVLCITSDWEGFGLAAVEALALGVPVVCTKTGGLPTIVDAACGAVCDTEEKMADYLLKILTDDDLYRKLSKGALDKAKKLDNTERYMRGIRRTYQQICRK